ncbi:MAG TPA: MFS transporter [Dactylosporangium sp.]|nr:MFS transporter [Dactylosporangium sp.]
MTTVVDQGALTSAPEALWTRDFSLYFGARAVSLLGDAMMPVAAALAVGALYGVSGVGYVLAVWTAPFVLLVVFGGVFADRLGARTLMVGADVVRTVTQGTLAAAFFAGVPPMWLLLLASALSGAAAAMFQPGVNGMVPLVARDPQRANGTLKIADAVTQLGGPALAGVLIALTGPGPVYAVDAATFLLSGVCLGLIRRTPLLEGRQTSTVLRDLHRGWQEFRSRTWMWSVILIWMCFGLFVFGPYIPLASHLVSGRLGEAAYGWAVAGLGTGTVIGGLVTIRFRPSRPLAAGAVALVGFVAVPLSVVLEPPLPALVAGHILGGAAWAFWSVMWSTSVQTLVPAEVLNRVTAYEVAGSVSGIAVGQALVGPVSTLVAPRDLLAVSAVVTAAVVATLLLVRPIRTLRRAA